MVLVLKHFLIGSFNKQLLKDTILYWDTYLEIIPIFKEICSFGESEAETSNCNTGNKWYYK